MGGLYSMEEVQITEAGLIGLFDVRTYTICPIPIVSRMHDLAWSFNPRCRHSTGRESGFFETPTKRTGLTGIHAHVVADISLLENLIAVINPSRRPN